MIFWAKETIYTFKPVSFGVVEFRRGGGNSTNTTTKGAGVALAVTALAV